MLKKDGVQIYSEMENILVSYYNGEQITEQQTSKFQKFLKKIREDCSRLECSCFQLSIGNRDGFHYLSKPPKRDHSSNCLFKNKLRAERIPPFRPREPNNIYIDIMAGTGTASGSARGGQLSGTGATGAKRVSKLMSAVLYLFDKAKTNSDLGRRRSYADTVKNIERAAAEIGVSPHSDITLNSILHFKSKYNSSEVVKLLEGVHDSWNDGSTFHQIILMACDKIEEYDDGVKLYTIGKSKAPVEIASLRKGAAKSRRIVLNKIGNQSKNHGPFIFAIVVTLGSYNKNGVTINFPKIEKCIYHYIDNKSDMCLLESTYERGMLWALRKHLGSLTGENYSLEKPIYNMQDTRPDFVLEINDKKLVVEVAGIDSDVYREAKERMHPIMEAQIGPVKEFDATNLNHPFYDFISWVEVNIK